MVAAAMAYPMAFPDHSPSYHAPPPKYEPPIHHAPVHKGYGHEEVLGRVKMQVYRGPNEHPCDPYAKDCYSFAPWGYYNTQPADFHKKKYH